MVGGTNVLAAEWTNGGPNDSYTLDGNVADGISAQELAFELLSLHRVSVGRNIPTERFEHSPAWSTEAIAAVRGQFKCTCESCVRSGWVCVRRCVLASLSILGLLNIEGALRSVPVRHTPGRPQNRGGALTREEEQGGYFTVANLVRLFVRRPGQPLRWSVVDEWDVSTAGETVPSTFMDKWVSVRLTDGVYVWSACFDDGDMRDYEAEELAEAVRRAHLLGVNVSN